MSKLFTCSQCGSRTLVVEHRYTQVWPWEKKLLCTCEAESGSAATQWGTTTTAYEAKGNLGPDHCVAIWDENTFGSQTQVEGQEVFCRTCFTTAAEEDWEYAESEEAEERESEWYVCCGGCQREIEFGWSHPDRTGCIWPVECADFNPRNCWPEERYETSWEQKGWLHSHAAILFQIRQKTKRADGT